MTRDLYVLLFSVNATDSFNFVDKMRRKIIEKRARIFRSFLLDSNLVNMVKALNHLSYLSLLCVVTMNFCRWIKQKSPLLECF